MITIHFFDILIANTVQFPTQKLFYYLIPIVIIIGVFALWKNTHSENDIKSSGELVVIENKSALIDPGLQNNEKFKGWEETLSKQEGSRAESDNYVASSTNKTETLGRQLFSDYVSLKQSGGINDESKNQLATKLAKNIQGISTEATYTKKDLRIGSDSSESALRNYANKLGLIREKYRDRFTQNMTSSSFISPSDPNFQSNISFAAGLYTAQAKEMVNLSTPSNIADIHLKLVNSYAGSGAGLEKMNLLAKDPLMSAVGLKEFDSSSKNEQPLLAELRSYLITNGILFSSDDDASSLWNSQ